MSAAKIITVKLIVKMSREVGGSGAGGGADARGGEGRARTPVTDTNRADLRALEPHWNLSGASIYVSFYLFRSY